ncbi:unnamed protein product [Rhodiola kirilowii]
MRSYKDEPKPSRSNKQPPRSTDITTPPTHQQPKSSTPKSSTPHPHPCERQPYPPSQNANAAVQTPPKIAQADTTHNPWRKQRQLPTYHGDKLPATTTTVQNMTPSELHQLSAEEKATEIYFFFYFRESSCEGEREKWIIIYQL